RPLIITTGTSGSCSRSRLSVAIPSSSPGIMRSSRIASGSRSAANPAPWTPELASRVVYPSPTSSADTIRRRLGSSSMMRISPSGVISARYRASLLPGARDGTLPGTPRCAFAGSASGARSDNSLVVNRCPSEMRSTSTATDSMACSIRVNRSVRSLGNAFGSTPRSMRLACARASGNPTTIATTMSIPQIGTRTSGPTNRFLQRRFGRQLVDGEHEADLRAFAGTARRIHRPAMCQHRLTRDRQPQPRAARLLRDVRIPNPRELFRRDPTSGVAHAELHRVVYGAAAVRVATPHPHLHVAAVATRIHRVHQHVRQRPSKRVVVPGHERDVIIDVHVHRHTIGRDRARRVSRQLTHVHRGRRTLRQTAELRKVASHLFQPPRLRLQHIHYVGKPRIGVTLEAR